MDNRTAEDCKLLLGHTGPVYSTSFCNDRNYLTSCSEDGTGIYLSHSSSHLCLVMRKPFLPYANKKTLLRQYNTCSCYVLNFKTLASFCGCAGRFVSYLVANPQDRFSCNEAHLCLMASITVNLHTVNFLNIRTPKTFVVSKIWTMWLYDRVMSPNDADRMANSVDPDQTAPRLIWVCTVCPSVSIRKLRIITVISLAFYWWNVILWGYIFAFAFHLSLHIMDVPNFRSRLFLWKFLPRKNKSLTKLNRFTVYLQIVSIYH